MSSKMLGITPFVWTNGDGKGMISVYQTFKAYVDNGFETHMIIATNNLKNVPKVYNGIIIHAFKLPVNLYPKHEFGVFNSPFEITYKNSIFNYFIGKLFWLLFVIFGFIKGISVSRKIKPDLIYGLTPHGSLVAFLISFIRRIPNITRLYGTYLYPYLDNKIQLLLRFPEYLAFKLPCTAFIMTNDGTKGDEVAKKLGIPQDKLLFWINGVDGIFEKYKELEPKTLSNIKMNTNTKTILCVGRLAKWKRHDRIIAAALEVIKEYPSVQFRFVGDGSNRSNLERIVREKGLDDYFHFVGSVPHSTVHKYFQQADIFVSVNDFTNLGNPLIEAMISRLPIVTLDLGGIDYLIKNNINGILVEKDNSMKLSTAILTLLNDEQFADSLAENAYVFARKNILTWKQRGKIEVDKIISLIKH